MTAQRRLVCFHLLIAIAIGAQASSCQILGLIGYAKPDPTVGPAYKGLAGQSVAVMVWADRASAIDWPSLQLDMTRGIQSRLKEAADVKKPPKELEGTKFAAAESAVRYQRDHPEMEAEPITTVAPRLNITRLIYVEVQQFSTRPEESVELFRGTLVGNLKVIEIQNGKSKIAFQEDNIKVVFPKESPEQGMPGLGDNQIYEKTLEYFSTQVVNRFLTHIEPRDDH